EPIVEPRRRAIAQIGPDGLVDWSQDLEQNESHADKDQPIGQPITALNGSNEHPHRDRKDRRQHAAQDENNPPCDRQAAIGLRQHGEKLPFIAGAETLKHGEHLSPMSPEDTYLLKLASSQCIALV